MRSPEKYVRLTPNGLKLEPLVVRPRECVAAGERKSPITLVFDGAVVETAYLHLVFAAVGQRRGDGPVEATVAGRRGGNGGDCGAPTKELDLDVAGDVVRPGDGVGGAFDPGLLAVRACDRDLRRCRRLLDDGHALVGSEVGDSLDDTAGPGDLDLGDERVTVEAEVGGQVAPSAQARPAVCLPVLRAPSGVVSLIFAPMPSRLLSGGPAPCRSRISQ